MLSRQLSCGISRYSLRFGTKSFGRSGYIARQTDLRANAGLPDGVRFMSGAAGAGGDSGGKGSGWDWGSLFGGKGATGASQASTSNSFDAPLSRSSGTGQDDFGAATRVDFSDANSPIDGSAPSLGESVSSQMADVAQTVEAVTAVAGADLDRLNPSHVMMQVVEKLHLTWDMPYFQAILVMAVGVRVFLFPLAVSGMVNASRMQHIKPEMNKMNARMLADPMRAENKDKYDKEVRELFLKHQVNPAKQLVVPLVQIPIFMSMFFAMRNMGEHYPGFATGGTQWFVDLTVADATMALPVVNAAIFLTMIEMGGENGEMKNQSGQHKMLLNIMRVVGVSMVPLTMNMPAGLFVYWVGNGLLSLTQMAIFKSPAMRERFGIMAPPPPEPAAESAAAAADVTVGASVSPVVAPATATAAATSELKDKSPFLKLYEENLRLVEANKRLMERAAKEGKYS